MKANQYVLTIVMLLIFNALQSQVLAQEIQSTYQPGAQFSIRAGYDVLPFYKNNTPFIDYKGGAMFGASFDYYWKWFGLGADVDYIRNAPKSIYPRDTFIHASTGELITDHQITTNKISRLFYGIGPNFRWMPNAKNALELNLRGGLANIKGGLINHLGITNITMTPVPLTYHGGYQQNFVPTAKAQLRYSYFFNQHIGLQLGAYYMHHFNVEEQKHPLGGYTGYQTVQDGITNTFFERRELCNCNISSVGVFTGLAFRFGGGGKDRSKKSENCVTCAKYSLAVTARDKFTNQVLANTDIAVKNMQGEVVQTGTTNQFGVVTFNNIVAENYLVEGVLHEVNLTTARVMKEEFKPNQTVQKEIQYVDENFILKGAAVVCNTTTPLNGVSVVLKNKSAGEQKTTVTDSKGEFIFHVKQRANYELYGKKESYFSQTEMLSTSDFNRSQTLFVKLEICMEEVDCDRIITLNNIYYDFDQATILPAAKEELNKLARFMEDNPSLRVELRSHTDAKGSNTYNEKLSQRRADAAVEYLSTQGINRSRLVPVGYGETKLLNECGDGVDCPDSKHQINRRTEFKVICTK